MHIRINRTSARASIGIAGVAVFVVAVLVALAVGRGRSGGRVDLAQGRAQPPPMSLTERAPVMVRLRPEPRTPAARPVFDMYRGLGSWVDIYERTSFDNPERAVAGMKAHGVRTLYIETSNYRRQVPIKYPATQARFIEAAHARGIKVVAWYLPGFRDIQKDLWRTMRAIDFRTPSGQRFDSFALDIESPEVRNPWVRTRRLVALSNRIRAAVGPSYPLGAIVPSPLGMQRNPTYWPGFPYRTLARDYQVFVPMTYFTWRVSGQQDADAYTTACIQIVRHAVGDRSVPIHVIGGISDDSTQAEARGFVQAIRQQGIIGASYYAFHGTTKHLWWELSRIPTNPVQAPALPVRTDYPEPLGNLPAGDASHPKDVVFQTGPVDGARVLRFEVFDVQAGEVTLRVNWHPVSVLTPTATGTWSTERRVRLPRRWLRRDGKNYISFTARGRDPNWQTWGVRGLGLGRG